jgi:hypothetical protein
MLLFPCIALQRRPFVSCSLLLSLTLFPHGFVIHAPHVAHVGWVENGFLTTQIAFPFLSFPRLNSHCCRRLAYEHGIEIYPPRPKHLFLDTDWIQIDLLVGGVHFLNEMVGKEKREIWVLNCNAEVGSLICGVAIQIVLDASAAETAV